MTSHADLVAVAARWLYGTRSCRVVLTERGRQEVPDAIGWGRCCIVVECKVSRADFFADMKKPHRQAGAIALGEERWYLTPAGLLRDAGGVPPSFGLLEWTGRIVRRVKAAPVLAVDADGLALERRLLLSELAIYHAQGIGYRTLSGREALPHLSDAQLLGGHSDD